MTDFTMGQRIAEERKKLGISQEALGEKTGVSRQAISKWESDGAVPEIDKLIALSRLFGVSVGWLLGIEEAPAPGEDAQEDTLTEKQLQMVEEIVRKYRPKRSMHLSVWISIFALLVMMAAIYKFSARVESSQGNYAAVSSQINELRSQIQRITDEAEAPAGLNMFGEYRFEPEQLTDAPGARIRFSAMPNTWQEGNSGYLTVTREGMEPLRIDCGWNGAWLTADFSLEAANGYDYCMTIVHADGTQEQQLLHDETAEDLAVALSLSNKVDIESAVYSLNGNFTLYNCTVSTTMPMTGFRYGEQTWHSVDLLLCQNGQELGRFSVLDDRDTEHIRKSYNLVSVYGNIQFQNVQPVPNEEIVLYLSAELSNGLSSYVPVGRWVIDANSELIWL